jgi:bifunctional polynucleotide phosphatase/kinase
VTNQSKSWKTQQITTVLLTLGIPLTICIATAKENYKPSLHIYHEAFTTAQLEKIDKNKSFMVGDALGRVNDHSNCDLMFSEAVGIKCLSPENVFPFDLAKEKITKVIASSSQEVVIMMGYPGSGKSALCSKVFDAACYYIASGDTFKTSTKMIKSAIDQVKSGLSVVFDATNATSSKRAEYVAFAKSHGIPVRCIHVDTSLDESLARNNLREKPVPKIVYNVYKKRFEAPNETEGFTLITIK